MKGKVAVLGILMVAVVGGVCVGQGENERGTPLPLATVPELLGYPTPMFTEEAMLAERLFIAILPATGLAVILRPITEAEFGSFQIQAVGAQMIDQQMLAAAIALPAMAPEDVAGFADELIAFLHWMVNEISGFAVFADVLLP
jgi:stage V sporulation protein SpoVS